ncbi:hypothetical protein NDU88_005001 [Pleurodeles waltl]|uniref:Uncharacterized protein n=1 Tax=Pleurodeles waltl TaxID=8319 RepID=A0AAV7M9A1_PLEWA|nr:hypothetical protein NDU88_005001 [Pleurodeles waltl]
MCIAAGQWACSGLRSAPGLLTAHAAAPTHLPELRARAAAGCQSACGRIRGRKVLFSSPFSVAPRGGSGASDPGLPPAGPRRDPIPSSEAHSSPPHQNFAAGHAGAPSPL